jgi:putative aminopeptidase FrvX
MNRLYNDYKSLWCCFNPSKGLNAMHDVMEGYLKDYPHFTDKYGNIFVGDFDKNRACLVAHLDSVHEKKSVNIVLKGGILSSDNGIGGDDKCGIVAILEILKKNKNVNAIFPIDEEIGGVGADLIGKDILQNVKYFIEIDRVGNSDIIFESGCNKIASDDFIKDLLPIAKKYGFKKDFGTFTDVNVLTETSLKSAINVSAGYYNAHTKKEYVVLKELDYTINFVEEILHTLQNEYNWEGYIEYEQYDENIEDFDGFNIEDLIEYATYIGYDDIVLSYIIKAHKLGYDTKKEDFQVVRPYAIDKTRM